MNSDRRMYLLRWGPTYLCGEIDTLSHFLGPFSFLAESKYIFLEVCFSSFKRMVEDKVEGTGEVGSGEKPNGWSWDRLVTPGHRTVSSSFCPSEARARCALESSSQVTEW